MSDVAQNVSPLPMDVNVAKVLLEPQNHALAVWARKCFELGVPAHSMIEMFLNHMASICAQVEPPGAREELVKGLVKSFAPMVIQHHEAKYTTPGGILMPKAAK